MAEKSAGRSSGGRFVWRDLMTKDLEGSKKFYSELFGWKTSQHDMGAMGQYTMLSMDEKGIGGMMPLEAEFPYPSHWVSYITVPDVDAAVEQIPALGGTVCSPGMDIPDVGRFAVVGDAQGAVFSPFRDLNETPEDDGPSAPGTFCWSELLTTDQQAAAVFYGAVCGWAFGEFDLPGMPGKYLLCQRDGKEVAGIMQMPPGAEARPYWLPYVAVEGVDAMAARVEDLGGKIWVPPHEIPGVGRIAVTEDPSGAMFALYKKA